MPEIEASAAYRDGGLIAITFDQAPQTGPDADPSSCCDQPAAYPNLAAAAAAPQDDADHDRHADATRPRRPPRPPTTPTPATTTTPIPAPPTAAAGTTRRRTPVADHDHDATPPTRPSPTGGGGQVGLLLISAVRQPGTTYGFGSYNHFSLLRSIEDLFGLEHLGYAADPALPAFDNSVYNKG